MWVELERIRTQTPNLFTEILVRVFIISFVCILQVCVKPHLQDITESELLKCMQPRKDSYVPPLMIVVIVVFVPLIYLCLPYALTKNREDTIQAVLAWTLAISITALATEATKLLVGRPRPDYYYRCYPSGRISGQSDCTGNMKDVMEGRKSFPSGHSSFSFCSLGFLSIWLCGRLRVLSRDRYHALRLLVCLLPLVLASLVAVSRYYDNHHHWEDIIVGSVLGFVVSYVCYRQYFNSLTSEMSGLPYLVTESESDSTDIDDLDMCQSCSSNACKYSIKSQKKYT